MHGQTAGRMRIRYAVASVQLQTDAYPSPQARHVDSMLHNRQVNVPGNPAVSFWLCCLVPGTLWLGCGLIFFTI
jgi:hypothetical protein